jgi:hypothetical protein
MCQLCYFVEIDLERTDSRAAGLLEMAKGDEVSI